MKAFRFKRFARKSYSVFNSIHKAVTIGVLSGVDKRPRDFGGARRADHGSHIVRLDPAHRAG